MGAIKELKSHEAKAKEVNDLVNEIKKSKTLMVVSIKGLPSKQFQDIKRAVREHAKVKVAKKNILMRVIKGLKKESLLPLEKFIEGNCAFAISDLEGFELAGIFAKKKNPMFAKAGQISPEDIEVKEGPTDLPPGPAISEMGALGIPIAVEDGKIAIKKAKIVVKKDQEIKANVASMLQKLNIQPFTIGLEPVAVYDIENEKIYTDVKIDSEEARNNLVSAAGKALGFAQKIAYYCKETIGYLLAKANMQAQALNKLQPAEEKKETSEEKSEDTQLNKPEETA